MEIGDSQFINLVAPANQADLDGAKIERINNYIVSNLNTLKNNIEKISDAGIPREIIVSRLSELFRLPFNVNYDTNGGEYNEETTVAEYYLSNINQGIYKSPEYYNSPDLLESLIFLDYFVENMIDMRASSIGDIFLSTFNNLNFQTDIDLMSCFLLFRDIFPILDETKPAINLESKPSLFSPGGDIHINIVTEKKVAQAKRIKKESIELNNTLSKINFNEIYGVSWILNDYTVRLIGEELTSCNIEAHTGINLDNHESYNRLPRYIKKRVPQTDFIRISLENILISQDNIKRFLETGKAPDIGIIILRKKRKM